MQPDDSVQQTLKKIVEQHGSFDSSTDSLRRCRGLLRDLAPGYTLEMNLLMFALEIGAPERIAAGTTNPELVLSRLAIELEQTQGVSAENARWSVAAWAYALGVNPVIAQLEQKHPNASKILIAQQHPQQKTEQVRRNAPLWQQIGIVLIDIPAGEFLYGAEKQSIYLDEFWIAKTPITNAQYESFVDATGHRKPDHWTAGMIPIGKEHHPVVFVSWDDAQAFCNWVGLALPTERQWEKAARSTDGRTYPWGNQPPDKSRCNFNSRSIKTLLDLAGGNTTPVGSYLAGASPYGVLDLAGNVWEWCHEWHGGQGTSHVSRGGSWRSRGIGVRVAERGYLKYPKEKTNNVGFRCVRLL